MKSKAAYSIDEENALITIGRKVYKINRAHKCPGGAGTPTGAR